MIRQHLLSKRVATDEEISRSNKALANMFLGGNHVRMKACSSLRQGSSKSSWLAGLSMLAIMPAGHVVSIMSRVIIV